MTQTNCPNCDSTRLQHQENYGYWECLDCDHTWALDADDPDYEDLGEDFNEVYGANGEPLDQEFYDGSWHISPLNYMRRSDE
jgi:hypothetical protein